jgi:hypothetical protein
MEGVVGSVENVRATNWRGNAVIELPTDTSGVNIDRCY